MYVPSSFKVADPATLHSFIHENSFGLLCSYGKGGLRATHLPLLLDESSGPHGRLLGHIARANDQWREISGEVLAVFHGPHAYISPTWYGEPNTVPTWNYAAVHVYGTFSIMTEHAEVLALLNALTTKYESALPQPWTTSAVNGDYREKLMGAITGFRIDITRIEGTWKLSQTRSKEAQQRVAGMLKHAPDTQARAISELMQRNLQQS